MAFRPSVTNTFLLLTVLVILLPVETYAFGAGDIPDFAYLNDKAFRHGDIESILETLSKSVAGHGGHAIGGTSLLGFASSVIKHVASAGGAKFTKSDVKKVYFGNWLRDYSQAMDIAGLSKLSYDTLILVVACLGFMTFGFATEEFEVTADRIGVYLPVEHIDNPKGYAEKEGDARQFHPKLRPPVRQEELEIDEHTGMKKYMATENQGWDTSTAFIRRTFQACIYHGRIAKGNEGADLWEAYRCLGTGLHTMEDLLAHSNWCEIALRKLGYKDVFCHVGDRVTVNTPNGPAPPLVTGTFGSADFLHSLLGEAGDKLSQASVTDLSAKMSDASQGGQGKPDISMLKNILGKFGGGGDDDKLNQGEEIKKQSQGYNFNPDDVAPPDVQKQLFDLLKWRDGVLRDIIKKIEMVPGLENLLDEFSNALNEYVYTILAPYLGPILSQSTSVLDEGSKAVIDNDDQYEVFNNENASDPSHSLLSKDHFGLILNEPAGKIAQVVVEYSVNLLVKTWYDDSNPDDVITQILEAFHHPYYATGRSQIQNMMFDHMQRWIGGQGSDANDIIQALTKQSVRDHHNKRKGLDDTVEAGYGGCGHGSGGGYKPTTQSSGGVAAGYGASKPTQSYGGNANSGSYNTGTTGYGGSQGQHGGGRPQSSNTHSQSGGYGSQRRDDDNTASGGGYGGRTAESNTYGSSGYGSQQTSYGGQKRDEAPSYGGGYGGQKRDETSSYGGGYGGQKREEETSYGNTGYGSQRKEETSSYGGGYGSQKKEEYSSGYGSQKRDETSSYGGGYSSQKKEEDSNYGNTGYGSQKRDETSSYGGGYGKTADDTPSYGGGYGGGQRRGDDGSGHGGHHQRKDDEDNNRGSGYNASYGQTTASGYGGGQSTYGGGGGYGQTETSSGYGRSNEDDNEGRKHHGRKHSGERQGYEGGNSGYGQTGGGYAAQSTYGQTETSGGYAPSYGGRDDTFGAERLNIGGGDDEDEERKRHHHKQHHEGY